MNVIKEYNTAKKKKGNVSFGAAHGARWIFRAADKESGAWEKIMKVRGGRDVAERVADVISKSWLRTAGKGLKSFERIDGKARRQIDVLCQVRTLKDYDGNPEWWSNEVPQTGQETVKMVSPQPAPAPFSVEDLIEDPAETAEPLPVVEAENPIGELMTA